MSLFSSKMNAFPATFSLLACVMLATLSHQMVQETSADETQPAENVTTSTQAPQLTSSTVNTAEGYEKPKNCSTARHLLGNCIQRQFCEFSTAAIDLTLFMPAGYKRPCEPGEVCCPHAYIVEASNQPQKDANFNFDDDEF